MLTAENVSCSYDDTVIFEEVNLNLKDGALVILHGPNGSGKTSFLEILAGIMPPSHGEVSWRGNSVASAVQNGEISLSFFGHDYAIKPELTVLENLEYWAKLQGREDLIEQALNQFGLMEYVNVPCSKLSDGWKRRVALARLVCSSADVWILDEPYNNLDNQICEELDKLVAAKAKSGGIVILSSHTLVPIDFAEKLNIAKFAPRAA